MKPFDYFVLLCLKTPSIGIQITSFICFFSDLKKKKLVALEPNYLE